MEKSYSSAIPTNFTKQRAGKINVGMSIPPSFGGIKLVDNSWSGASDLIKIRNRWIEVLLTFGVRL